MREHEVVRERFTVHVSLQVDMQCVWVERAAVGAGPATGLREGSGRGEVQICRVHFQPCMSQQSGNTCWLGDYQNIRAETNAMCSKEQDWDVPAANVIFRSLTHAISNKPLES